MRRLLALGPLLLLAAFSPPDRLRDRLPSQGAQEGPPRSWIPERAQQPPVTVTPDFPKPPTPQTEGNTGSAVPGPQADLPPIDLQICATPEKTGAKPSEAFVTAYNAAREAISARHHDEAFAFALEAEGLASGHMQRSVVLSMQMLIAAAMGDAAKVEQLIARRIELGCLTASERRMFEQARDTVKGGK